MFKTQYDPAASTDIVDYPLFGFANPYKEIELHLGLTSILRQSFPRWFVTLMEKYEPKLNLTDDYIPANVSILDARIRDTSFHETGFTWIPVEKRDIDRVQNWRSQEDIKSFQKALEPKLRELYPNATHIEYTYSVDRGGNQLGDQPAAINAPHLDYYQNFTARQEFPQTYPPSSHAIEQRILLGTYEGQQDDEELKVLLGIWKPIISNNPVCDHPLAIMDARTFYQEQEQIHPVHIDFGIFTFHNLKGAVRYHPTQQWYYRIIRRKPIPKYLWLHTIPMKPIFAILVDPF